MCIYSDFVFFTGSSSSIPLSFFCCSSEDSGTLGSSSVELDLLNELLIFVMAPFTMLLVPATTSLRFSSSLCVASDTESDTDSNASDAPSLTLDTNPLNLSLNELGAAVVDSVSLISSLILSLMFGNVSSVWCC